MLQKDGTRGILAQKEMLNDISEFYLLKRKELLLLCLHNARGDVVAAEPLLELEPSERLAVLN